MNKQFYMLIFFYLSSVIAGGIAGMNAIGWIGLFAGMLIGGAASRAIIQKIRYECQF